MKRVQIACGLLMVIGPWTLSAQPAPTELEPVALATAATDPVSAEPAAPAESDEGGPTETDCTDRKDNDGDGMVDCSDADCFEVPTCQPDGEIENTNERCSDWIDNDRNGVFDCDDSDCFGPGVTICEGSWQGPLEAGGGGSTEAPQDSFQALPALEGGLGVEDLIGKGRDNDGERNDELCSDGVDNDNDGLIDCADYGCRFDPSVNICRGNPGLRFSVVASVGQIYDITENTWDTRFTKMQLRTFGPLPFIQDSFFLLSFRTEKTVRNTFAMFQVPIGHGHFINVNSGGGGLSSALIISDAKQLLLDPAYYVYNAFEQGNGAAVELSGPITKNRNINYRLFTAGGSGRFNGNIGGRYFKYDNTNYTYAAGGQLAVNVRGYYNRFDTPYLYTSVPMTLAFTLGAKYDQRSTERFAAANAYMIFRWKRFHFAVEDYSRRVFDYGSWQTAYNVQAGFLIVPKRLLLAADFGQYLAGAFENPPDDISQDLDTKPLDELQLRCALHYYFWKNIGLLSFRYQFRKLEQQEGDTYTQTSSSGTTQDLYEDMHEVRMEVQYRF